MIALSLSVSSRLHALTGGGIVAQAGTVHSSAAGESSTVTVDITERGSE